MMCESVCVSVCDAGLDPCAAVAGAQLPCSYAAAVHSNVFCARLLPYSASWARNAQVFPIYAYLLSKDSTRPEFLIPGDGAVMPFPAALYIRKVRQGLPLSGVDTAESSAVVSVGVTSAGPVTVARRSSAAATGATQSNVTPVTEYVSV